MAGARATNVGMYVYINLFISRDLRTMRTEEHAVGNVRWNGDVVSWSKLHF